MTEESPAPSATTVADLQQQVEELTEVVESQQERIEKLEDEVEFFENQFWDLDDLVAGETGTTKADMLVDEHGDVFEQLETIRDSGIATDGGQSGAIDDVKAEVDQEVDRLANDLSMVRRRVNAVAEAAEVEVTEAEIMGDDKITRVLRNGASAVATNSNPTKVALRAAEVLRHIDEWGSAINDAYGRRFQIDNPSAKQRLKDARGENLQSNQVTRVFEKIVEWAEDSPRTASVGNNNGTTTLELQVSE